MCALPPVYLLYVYSVLPIVPSCWAYDVPALSPALLVFSFCNTVVSAPKTAEQESLRVAAFATRYFPISDRGRHGRSGGYRGYCRLRLGAFRAYEILALDFTILAQRLARASGATSPFLTELTRESLFKQHIRVEKRGEKLANTLTVRQDGQGKRILILVVLLLTVAVLGLVMRVNPHCQRSIMCD